MTGTTVGMPDFYVTAVTDAILTSADKTEYCGYSRWCVPGVLTQ